MKPNLILAILPVAALTLPGAAQALQPCRVIAEGSLNGVIRLSR